MGTFLKSMDTIFFVIGLISGIILLIKATENINEIIGISSIVSGILIGLTFNFFGQLVENSESQIILLRDIRDHFYPDEEEKEETEVNE